MQELALMEDILLCTYTKCDLALKKTNEGTTLKVKATKNISKERNGAKTVFRDVEKLKKYLTKSDLRPELKCDQCDYSTYDRQRLSYHLRTHSKIKPYSCFFCSKRFGQIGHRNLHEKRHRQEKNFKCTECDKAFVTRQNLESHQRLHLAKSFRCEFCTEVFRHKHTLVTHMRQHTNVHPYRCKRCGKGFKQSTPFKVHKCLTGEWN